MKSLAGLVSLVLWLATGWAQYRFGTVCSTSSPFATLPNNGHKLAYRSEMLSPERDTVTLVFQSNDSIYLTVSGNGATTPWRAPVGLYPGADPAITWGRNNQRQLVWQMLDTVSGRLNIFYRNLEYRMQPINVSGGSQDGFHPDVFGDSLGVAHIVWEENEGSGRRVYYRKADVNGVIGARFAVASQLTRGWAQPAIEGFGDTIAVIWAQFDSTQNPPYKIMRRCQVRGVWQAEEVLAQSSELLNQPALDFGTAAGEGFSGCWQRVVSGNSEVQFYNGNGGGYATSGVSTAPVLSTIGTVWSYLFWQEDSAGVNDIYTHFYYFMTGWTRGSIRQFFPISEPVFAPSCLGALAVWIQGDTIPYRLMWGFFDYPIANQEGATSSAKIKFPKIQFVRNLLFLPAVENNERRANHLTLTDLTGRKVLSLKSGTNDVSGLGTGVYFVKGGSELRRVIILR